jgi:2-phosphosulfolactate phosphatase
MSMKFHYADLTNCHTATDIAIVIDVIRAFTNAAFAFSKGAKEIYPVGTVEEALQFKRDFAGALACGEIGGIPPAGFDFGNAPTQTRSLDLRDRVIAQRTSAGTQGIVRSLNARAMFAASFVVAGATVKHIQNLGADSVTFVITGKTAEGHGDEDFACAEYLEARLKGQRPDPAPFIERLYRSRDALLHLDPDIPAFPKSDLTCCADIDAFDFIMPVVKEGGRFVMRAVKP